jgi:hypothetical protein
MKFRVERRGISIIPENEQDEAYIEDTLGLKNHHDSIPLVRENAHGLSCMGKLSTHPFPAPKEKERDREQPTASSGNHRESELPRGTVASTSDEEGVSEGEG